MTLMGRKRIDILGNLGFRLENLGELGGGNTTKFPLFNSPHAGWTTEQNGLGAMFVHSFNFLCG